MSNELISYHHGTPSHESARLGIWVTSGGRIVSANHRVENRRLLEGLLQYCVEGTGIVRLPGRDLRIAKGDVFVNFPGVSHTFCSDPETGWDVRYIHYGGPYAAELIDLAGFTPYRPSINIGIHPHILDLFGRLYTIMKAKPANYQLDAGSTAILLLVELRKIIGNMPFADSDIVSRMTYKIRSLDEAVEIAGYSKYHFIHLFKRSTGISPWQYIMHLKVDKAKELLSDKRNTVRKVAALVGIDDPYYFSRMFKKITGVSPAGFRDSLQA